MLEMSFYTRRQHLMNIHAGNRPARADGKVAVLT